MVQDIIPCLSPSFNQQYIRNHRKFELIQSTYNQLYKSKARTIETYSVVANEFDELENTVRTCFEEMQSSIGPHKTI